MIGVATYLCFFFILLFGGLLILSLVQLFLLKLLPSNGPLVHLLKLGVESRLAVDGIVLVRVDYVLVCILRVVMVSDALSTHIRLRRHVHRGHRVAIHVIRRMLGGSHLTIVAAVRRRRTVSAIWIVMVLGRHVPAGLRWPLRVGVAASLVGVSRIVGGRRHVRVVSIESGLLWRDLVSAVLAVGLAWVVVALAALVGTRVLSIEISLILALRSSVTRWVHSRLVRVLLGWSLLLRVAVHIISIKLTLGSSIWRSSVPLLLVRILGSTLLWDNSLLHISSFLAPFSLLVLREFFSLRVPWRVE